VNVDAAIFKDENRFGWGAVVRDHLGSVKLTCNEGTGGMVSPELAEALAIRSVLRITRDNGFLCSVLASDCLSVIQKIQTKTMDRSQVGSVIGDIKHLATEFDSCVFQHVGRRVNGVAHKLARCSEQGVCNLSFDVVPEYIRVELCNDVV
jgi:ribonuclease HI